MPPRLRCRWQPRGRPAATANSAACRPTSPAVAQRVSIRRLRPSLQQLLQGLREHGEGRACLPRRPRPDTRPRCAAPRSPCCARAAGQPARRRAAEERDELAPLHSITSSARASTGGTTRPSALAVLRLITSSNSSRLDDRQGGRVFHARLTPGVDTDLAIHLFTIVSVAG